MYFVQQFNSTSTIMIKKLLIIKTGHAEVFTENKHSEIISLGDVLRTSFILNFYSDYQITWFTSFQAKPLIDSNSKIHQIETELSNISNTKYDLVINLEKNPIYNEFVKSCHTYYGFRYHEETLLVETLNDESMTFNTFLTLTDHNLNSFQFKLCHLLGMPWDNQKYELSRKPKHNNRVVIGLNWKSGDKWPEKQLPRQFWNDLSLTLGDSKIVSFQEGFSDLAQYIDWINSCDTVITLDSLGLHIALSLKKKVIALFGPTNHKHVEMYNYGDKLCYDIENISKLNEKICNLIEK